MSEAKEREAFAQRTDPGSNPTSAIPGHTYNSVPPMPGQYVISGPVSNPSYCGSGQALGGRAVLRKRSVFEAYLLWLILGLVGAHHFYLRRPGFGVLYFFTFGLMGCGYLIDLFRMPYLVKQANKAYEEPQTVEEKNISDAYTLWFPMGLLGFHHFYLNRPGWGVFYLFTLGGFGIGWLIDLCRIPYLVADANKQELNKREKRVGTAYALGMSPLGILGCHHFYLNRPVMGIVYFMTMGNFLIGWIVDWFRMPILVKRTNKNIAVGDDGTRYLDDAYLYWFPLGLLGAHHFYLNRPVWGILYFLTFGLLGIGWLVDGCRMHCMLKEANKLESERRRARRAVGGTQGYVVTPPMAEGYGAPVYFPPHQLPQSQQQHQQQQQQEPERPYPRQQPYPQQQPYLPQQPYPPPQQYGAYPVQQNYPQQLVPPYVPTQQPPVPSYTEDPPPYTASQEDATSGDAKV